MSDLDALPVEFVPDTFVPDPVVAKEFGTTLNAMWRWDQSKEMKAAGWPDRVQFPNGRNYRSRRALEAFKAGLERIGLQALNPRAQVPPWAREARAKAPPKVDRVQKPREVAQQPLGADPQHHRPQTLEKV
jgi:hypothetical protein